MAQFGRYFEVETGAHNQDGKLLMRFRRAVMIAKQPSEGAGAETPK